MMRKMMSVFLFLLLTLGCAACTAEEANTVKVKITVGEQVLYADFADNATSRYLMEKMPMTLPMMDLYGREMCYRFSGEDIPAEEARYGAFDVGKILYWTPWHSFVIVYAESGEKIDNLQYVGEIESGVELFAETGDCEVTFDVVRETETTDAVDAVSSATLAIETMPAAVEHAGSKTLVVYFSTNDTLRVIARIAADEIGADVFELVPENPYTEEDINYHQPGNRAGEEQWSGARPAIVSLPDNLDQYDTILLGYPIWGGQAPNILYTFLESVGLHDKTIIPFCTSNFVNPGSSADNMAKATDETVVWLPAVRIERNSTEEDIRAWAKSLHLTQEESSMRLLIGETEVPVTWENNESVEALRELLPLTIQMSMYGGFEQVGPIGQRIVRDDKQTTTNYGDIVLYSGNQIVVFYGSNSWAYTRLGHIDLSQQEMRDLLGHGDVTITMKEE